MSNLLGRRLVLLTLLSAVILQATTASASFASAVEPSATNCPAYDLASLFFEDFYPGTKWDNSNGARVIRWASVESGVLEGDMVTRPFSPTELDVVRSAFASFDAALDTIGFQEVTSEQAEITIGWVNLSVGSSGYWNASWNGAGLRTRATIRLSESSTFLLGSVEQLRHGVQHELGNVLGLGDIHPNPSFESVQEDPWAAPFGSPILSDFDRGMIRQLYGESVCFESVTTVLKRITCTRGRFKRKIAAEKPRCPAGWKRVGKAVVVGA